MDAFCDGVMQRGLAARRVAVVVQLRGVLDGDVAVAGLDGVVEAVAGLDGVVEPESETGIEPRRGPLDRRILRRTQRVESTTTTGNPTR
jgi:hypothetical protein